MLVQSSSDHSKFCARLARVPAPPTRRALRARYDRRADELVQVAAALFARRGYDQTTMADLAAELGIATGGLYHYVGGKEALLRRICLELTEPLQPRAHEALAGHDDPADRLRALVDVWVSHVVEHRDHMLVFQQERHVIDHGEQWRKVRDDRKRFERMVAVVLEHAHDRGATRLEDPRLSLAALLGMVNHTAQWHRPRGRLTAREIADGYVDLVLTPTGGGSRPA
jgi:TetR/AcrR family transcriptional regulator, cholesterol catabolism regulator